jgi:hypothetical protein
MRCPNCFSTKLVNAGKQTNASKNASGNLEVTGTTQRFICKDCHKGTVKPLHDGEAFNGDKNLMLTTIEVTLGVVKRLLAKSRDKDFLLSYNDVIKKLLDLDDARVQYELDHEGWDRSQKDDNEYGNS